MGRPVIAAVVHDGRSADSVQPGIVEGGHYRIMLSSGFPSNAFVFSTRVLWR